MIQELKSLGCAIAVDFQARYDRLSEDVRTFKKAVRKQIQAFEETKDCLEERQQLRLAQDLLLTLEEGKQDQKTLGMKPRLATQEVRKRKREAEDAQKIHEKERLKLEMLKCYRVDDGFLTC